MLDRFQIWLSEALLAIGGIGIDHQHVRSVVCDHSVFTTIKTCHPFGATLINLVSHQIGRELVVQGRTFKLKMDLKHLVYHRDFLQAAPLVWTIYQSEIALVLVMVDNIIWVYLQWTALVLALNEVTWEMLWSYRLLCNLQRLWKAKIDFTDLGIGLDIIK